MLSSYHHDQMAPVETKELNPHKESEAVTQPENTAEAIDVQFIEMNFSSEQVESRYGKGQLGTELTEKMKWVLDQQLVTKEFLKGLLDSFIAYHKDRHSNEHFDLLFAKEDFSHFLQYAIITLGKDKTSRDNLSVLFQEEHLFFKSPYYEGYSVVYLNRDDSVLLTAIETGSQSLVKQVLATAARVLGGETSPGYQLVLTQSNKNGFTPLITVAKKGAYPSTETLKRKHPEQKNENRDVKKQRRERPSTAIANSGINEVGLFARTAHSRQTEIYHDDFIELPLQPKSSQKYDLVVAWDCDQTILNYDQSYKDKKTVLHHATAIGNLLKRLDSKTLLVMITSRSFKEREKLGTNYLSVLQALEELKKHTGDENLFTSIYFTGIEGTNTPKDKSLVLEHLCRHYQQKYDPQKAILMDDYDSVLRGVRAKGFVGIQATPDHDDYYLHELQYWLDLHKNPSLSFNG